MILILLTWNILLLCYVVVGHSNDAYTACLCVSSNSCPDYAKSALPICFKDPSSIQCSNICCEACRNYALGSWRACQSERTLSICNLDIIQPTASSESDMFMEMSTEPSLDPEIIEESESPIMKNEEEDDDDSKEKESTTLAIPKTIQPVNATTVDLNTSSGGRPFSPAACECMLDGNGCDKTLARASGVCEAGIENIRQSMDCKFACCRLCLVNEFAPYCDEQVIQNICRKTIRMKN